MEKWIFERGIMPHDRRLKKPSVSHDMGGFSSLIVSQIPSLKFSPFPSGLGIDYIMLILFASVAKNTIFLQEGWAWLGLDLSPSRIWKKQSLSWMFFDASLVNMIS
jgi:hypothetical protein